MSTPDTHTGARALLDAIRAAMPTTAATREALARLTRLQTAAPADGDALNRLTAEIVEAARRGDAVDLADVDSRIIRAREAVAALEVRQGLVADAVGALMRAEDDAVADESDAGLDVIRGDVAAVVARARDLLSGPLADIHDADAAVDHDLTAEWREVRQLAERYGQARSAQRDMLRSVMVVTDVDVAGPPGNRRATRRLAASDQQRDVEAAVRTYGHVRNALDFHDPRDRDARPPWATGSAFVDLAWIVDTPAAECWVPTVSELYEAAARGAERLAEQGHRVVIHGSTSRSVDVGPVDAETPQTRDISNGRAGLARVNSRSRGRD